MANPTDSPLGGALPVARARQSLVTRILLALTTSSALLGVAGVVAAAAIVPPIGARRIARASAERALHAQLAVGEAVIATTLASQRRWTDMYRQSFGVVVATNTRVLHVGMPPTPLLRPLEDGPDELIVESYPYADDFTLASRSLLAGRLRALTLQSSAGAVDFIIDDSEWADALRVLAAATAARGDARALVRTQRDSTP